MSNWVGYAVSVNCGEPLGCYQGTILEADGNTITLTKAFRNGFPYPKSQVTLNAADIKDLKIIESRSEPSEQTHSTVAVTKNNKKVQRATVCENLQANPSSSGNQASTSNSNITSKSSNSRGTGQGPARSKPIDIQNTRNKNNSHTGSYGTGSTPKSRGGGGINDRARRRNEACFGDLADPDMANDFDFEGNLALFDKQALWEEMRSHKPDLVRRAGGDLAKFRHDENILGGAPPATRAIRVPDDMRGPLDYVTDEGVVVPSVSCGVRRTAWSGMARAALADSARVLLARAAADVALRLVGGGRRLDPRNAHQAPTVVALVGPHAAGACGVTVARLLHSHGVRTALYVAGSRTTANGCIVLQQEVSSLRLSSGFNPAARLEQLPSPDLVLLALYDNQLDDNQEQYEDVLTWVRGARAGAVCVEPPARGWDGVTCRAAVVGVLPPALAPSLGRVYLADVAPPHALFKEMRVTYRPPFGAVSVLALHPADS